MPPGTTTSTCQGQRSSAGLGQCAVASKILADDEIVGGVDDLETATAVQVDGSRGAGVARSGDLQRAAGEGERARGGAEIGVR